MTALQLQYWRDKEQARTNKATEEERRRSNLANEAELNRSNMAREEETNRHNVATEILGTKQYEELVRSNKAREAETNRSNLAHEAQAAKQLQLGYANLDYQYANLAHQQSQLAYNYSSLQEIAKHNRATEMISSNQLAETIRSDEARENQANVDNVTTNLQKTYALEETRKHNRAVEANQKYQTATGFLSTLVGAGVRLLTGKGGKSK